MIKQFNLKKAAVCAAGMMLSAVIVLTAMAAAVIPAAADETKPAAYLHNDEYGVVKTANLYDFLINGGASMIANYSSADMNVNSMAGGVEVLSCFAVTGTEAGGGTIAVPAAEVLNGRTLRSGERLQGFYDPGSGAYQAITTTTQNDIVSFKVPGKGDASDPNVCFIVCKTGWTPGKGYDYLAIGNSITMHPKREYWPDAMGMGATTQENDYFHQVVAGLPEKGKKNINSIAMNFAIWEISYGQRASTLRLIDGYLNADMDFVSIQLGDNVKNATGFEQDFDQLVAYIRMKCPKARIVIVGNYWSFEGLDEIKQEVAERYHCYYVDTSVLQDNPKYQFGQGIAYDANGVAVQTDNEGTSIHPNNAAMKYIADGILKTFK